MASRSFEVDRRYMFLKGSGLPVRIPVIEMVEIGAGGGSIARVDELRRITVGPDSAGSEPGPACYGRGGTGAAVTDVSDEDRALVALAVALDRDPTDVMGSAHRQGVRGPDQARRARRR